MKYKGNYNPEPLAWEIASRKMAARKQVDLRPGFVPITDLNQYGVKVAAITGTGSVTLSGRF